MILIIQDSNIKLSYNDPNTFKVFEKICDVKTYKNIPYTIMMVNINVDDDGVVEKYDFAFEELIVTINVLAVLTNKPSEKLREICCYHDIALLEIEY